MNTLAQYIEEVGVFYERFSMPKMAGRILGFLLATNEEKISFDEMVTQLKASKGSISSNVNLLLGQKLIEKFTVPGDRKTYYRFSSRNMYQMLDDKLGSVLDIARIFSNANKINNNPKSAKYRQIKEIVSFYQFLEQEIPKLKEKWNRKNKNR